ncbi:MAG TPA: DUF4363 family protein [Desulfosporosinus sp.]|nr:DUF4363 family protein [Desulfosporosinus sp.]
MRTLITILTIVIILSGGSFASYQYVETRTETMGILLKSIDDSITVGKWEQAQEDLSTAQQTWNNDNTWWSILLDNQEIDDINIDMQQLRKYIAIQDVSQSLGEITTLELHFDDIFDAELFNFKNVF